MPNFEPSVADAASVVDRVFRRERRALLASLIRHCGGDFALAEDALQESFAAALEHWDRDGVPANPAGWIATTARRKAIDRVRRDENFDRKQSTITQIERSRAVRLPDSEVERTIKDNELRLLFTCCHPALSLDARVALTLKTVAGLSTPEIASAFLVSEATMAQRIVRAKRKIKSAGIPYSTPSAAELGPRLSGVQSVLYLIFNEGYASATDTRLVRSELCKEAIRLGRLLMRLVPDEPEVQGLLALMLLHDARSASRVDSEGRFVGLEYQDRKTWDRTQIATGAALLSRAARHRVAGPYQFQAAIALEHAQAPTSEDTNWRRISILYEELLRVSPGPVIALNRAVAVAMWTEPKVGIAMLDDAQLRRDLDQYYLYHAARADLLRRNGQPQEAADAYRRALEICKSPVQREYLEQRLRDLADPSATLGA